MATSSLHPSSSNPFRDPNRTSPITPQATGTSTHSHNPFLSPHERLSPQATGASHYFTPQPTGTLVPQATGALNFQPGELTPQATGALAFSKQIETPSTGSAPKPTTTYTAPTGPPPSHNTPSPGPSLPGPSYTPTPRTPSPQPQRSTYAPPPGPPPAPRAPSPAPTINVEPPPPYTPAADVRQGEIPLETGPRRAYAPGWHPDGQTWRNEQALSPAPTSGRAETPVVAQPTGSSGSWSAYPGQNRFVAPPSASPSLGRANTTAGTTSTRAQPGPPTTVATPGRALLNNGRVLAYPAGYECERCHLTGYQSYDPSNPCRDCWPLFGQPYEGALTYAPWDSPEDVTSDAQNLQRPLPGGASRAAQRPQAGSSRAAQRPQAASSRPISHPQHSSYAGLGQAPGSLPPHDWSRPSPSSLRPTVTLSSRPSYPGRSSASISYSGRPPAGSVIVRPGDPRIGGRVCWKCSGDGWQYKSLGLETKTCSACNGLGRLF